MLRLQCVYFLFTILVCFFPTGCKTTTPVRTDNVSRTVVNGPATTRWDRIEALIKERNAYAAIQEASHLLLAYPDDSRGYTMRGRAHSLRRDYGLALADFSTAIRLDPQNAEAYARKAYIYVRRKPDSELALQHLDQAIALGMVFVLWDDEDKQVFDLFNLYNERAVLHKQLGNYAMALADINQAISTIHKDHVKFFLWPYYLQRSRIFLSLGRLDEAAEDARRVLGLAPDIDEAYLTLGFVSFHQDDLSQSLDYLDKAVACDPEIKGSIYSQAQCYRALIFWLNGERGRARETLKKTFLQSPEDAFIYFWLGYMAHENGDRNEARTCFARAEALMPDIYEQRKVFLSVTGTDRLTTLRKDQVRVASLYCKTPADQPAAATASPKAGLEIRQVKVVPNPVLAGNPFDIEIAYLVSDPSVTVQELALSYRFEIYQGQKKLFGSKELAMKGANGQQKVWVQHMNPVTMKGEFQVRAYVKYKDREDQAAADFRIQ